MVYHLKFCPCCGWHDGRVEIDHNRQLSPYEIAQIQVAVQDRLNLELTIYA